MTDHRGDGSTLRRILLPLILLGIAGLAAELFLLEHTESLQQWIPFAALSAGLVTAVAAMLAPRPLTLHALQAVMGLFVASGVLGIYLHLRGNIEFELESDPSLHGAQLLWSALRGATPALAPGAMVQLGLLGLLYTYRHPGLYGRG